MTATMRPISRNCKVCGERNPDRFNTVSGRYCIAHADQNPQPWKAPQPVDELTPILMQRSITELIVRKWGSATTGDCRGIPGNLNQLNCGACVEPCR